MSAFAPVHALIQSLDRERIAITVDHQAGQPITFAMHHAVSGGILDHPFPVSFSTGNAPQQKSAINGLRAVAEHSQSDLRCRTEMGGPQALALRIDHRHGVAGLSFGPSSDVACENPRVPGRNALSALFIYSNTRHSMPDAVYPVTPARRDR